MGIGIFITIVALILFGAMTIVAFESDRLTVRFKVKFKIQDPKNGSWKEFSQYLRWENPSYEGDVEKWAEMIAPHYLPQSTASPLVVVCKEGDTPLQPLERIRNGASFVIYVAP